MTESNTTVPEQVKDPLEMRVETLERQLEETAEALGRTTKLVSLERKTLVSLLDCLQGVVNSLMSISPHGRLIDADALQEYYEALDSDNGDYTESASETAETIANAPTILEASE